MKTKLWTFLLFTLLIGSNINGFTQDSLVVNSSFSQDTLLEVNYGNQFYGFRVSGSATLTGDFSVARVILVDDNGIEKLAYETTSQLQRTQSTSFSEYGEETYYIPGTTIDKVKIEVIDATINLAKLYFITQPIENYQQIQDVYRNQILSNKLALIQSYIDINELSWFAALKPQSYWTYAEKKAIFGEGYNLCGLEYFDGGIFLDITAKTKSEPVSEMIDHFDWREKHDANDPASLYWDGDNDYQETGNGWMTAIRCLGCHGWCWLFGAKDHIEAYTNVYYNRHLDVEFGMNFSPQFILANTPESYLSDYPSPVLVHGYGIWQSQVNQPYEISKNIGLIPFNCWPSNNQSLVVSSLLTTSHCSNPDYTLSIDDYHSVGNCNPNYYNQIKKDILQHGPMGILQTGHAMTLVGWGKIYANQVISKGGPGWDPTITIDPGDPLIGKTYWIVKQQGILGFGDDGYFAFVSSDISSSFYKDFIRYMYQCRLVSGNL